MNENIDLTKILKDCPKGWEFYSSVYGEVRFIEITPTKPVSCKSREDEWFGQEVLEHKYPVKFMAGICEYGVSKAGKLKDGVGECTFFPSREQRDWSKFTAPWYKNEQKSADKIEPRFKIGDWVVNKFGDSWHIDSLDKKNYQVSDGKGNYNYFPISKQDEIHLWTIQDAKDGDVLACNEEILLFKSYSVQECISSYCWYNGQTNNFHSKEVIDILLTTRNKVCPTTKEQRDALMKAMNDAGYEWGTKKN